MWRRLKAAQKAMRSFMTWESMMARGGEDMVARGVVSSSSDITNLFVDWWGHFSINFFTKNVFVFVFGGHLQSDS
jgi:hypothetical protein